MAYKLIIDRMYAGVSGGNAVMIAAFRVSDGVTLDANLETQTLRSDGVDKNTVGYEALTIANLKEKLEQVIDGLTQADADEAALVTQKTQLISDLDAGGYIKK